MSIRTLTLTALLAAILCICGPLTLPLGPAPLSLTTAVLMLMALLLGPKRSAQCCGLYLTLGLVGLPVFSGFTGGVGALLGPTGGFLLAYLPATLLWAWGLRASNPLRQGIACLLGHALLYALGTAWYVLQSGAAWGAAMAVCILPFLPGDALKIVFLLTQGNDVKARIGHLIR